MSVKQAVNELREEYFKLKVPMYKVLCYLEATVSGHLKELEFKLKEHERIDFESRIKDCDSAIDKLRRKEEGRDFEEGKKYSLKQLKDLVGLRILAFPASVMEQVNTCVSEKFNDWEVDHKQHGNMQIYKYYRAQIYGEHNIPCEIQIVSMLTGKFWDVEHSALYKPNFAYRGIIEGNLKMRDLYNDVMNKLAEFETAFEEIIKGG